MAANRWSGSISRPRADLVGYWPLFSLPCCQPKTIFLRMTKGWIIACAPFYWFQFSPRGFAPTCCEAHHPFKWLCLLTLGLHLMPREIDHAVQTHFPANICSCCQRYESERPMHHDDSRWWWCNDAYSDSSVLKEHPRECSESGWVRILEWGERLKDFWEERGGHIFDARRVMDMKQVVYTNVEEV